MQSKHSRLPLIRAILFRFNWWFVLDSWAKNSHIKKWIKLNNAGIHKLSHTTYYFEISRRLSWNYWLVVSNFPQVTYNHCSNGQNVLGAKVIFNSFWKSFKAAKLISSKTLKDYECRSILSWFRWVSDGV